MPETRASARKNAEAAVAAFQASVYPPSKDERVVLDSITKVTNLHAKPKELRGKPKKESKREKTPKCRKQGFVIYDIPLTRAAARKKAEAAVEAFQASVLPPTKKERAVLRSITNIADLNTKPKTLQGKPKSKRNCDKTHKSMAGQNSMHVTMAATKKRAAATTSLQASSFRPTKKKRVIPKSIINNPSLCGEPENKSKLVKKHTLHHIDGGKTYAFETLENVHTSDVVVMTRKKKHKISAMEEEKCILERVSDLPEALILHILSFLPYMDLVSNSMFSKPLGNALNSSTSIVLEENRFWKPHTDLVKHKLAFLECANYCIKNRHKNARLDKFILRVCTPGVNGRDRIKKLVRFAFENCVGETNIYLNQPSNRLPQLLPTLDSPSCYSFTTLKLSGFVISSVDELLSACPRLEDLSLVSCDLLMGATISSDKLKRLHLELEQRCQHWPLTMPITIGSCESLRELNILGEGITSSWVHSNIPKLRALEILRFSGSNGMDINFRESLADWIEAKLLEFSSGKDLTLLHCKNFEEIRFITKN